jgi:hypothetical protein
MNSKEYISSGIVESYVMGTATPEEILEMERLSSGYPEIKAELLEIEKAMIQYSEAYSVTPPVGVKEAIMDEISNETKVNPETTGLLSGNVKIINEYTPQRFSYWAIAASLLLLVSLVGNVFYIMKSIKMEDTLSSINRTNNNLYDSLQAIAVNYKQAQNDLGILKDPMYKIVELKGMKAAPDAKAMVCWCPMEKKVYVEIDKLPNPPAGMQYQLWAIVDGKPVSAGMLTLGSGLHRMTDIENAQAFAVTLEKEGGSPAPKGDMFAMGNI